MLRGQLPDMLSDDRESPALFRNTGNSASLGVGEAFTGSSTPSRNSGVGRPGGALRPFVRQNESPLTVNGIPGCWRVLIRRRPEKMANVGVRIRLADLGRLGGPVWLYSV